ncbi:MAG: hypothetical protein WCG87_03740 [Bacteroidota bacterium]
MFRQILLSIFILTVTICSCTTTDNNVTCVAAPAIENLKFRVVDTAGHDLLDTSKYRIYSPDSLFGLQPCNLNDTLISKVVKYFLPTSKKGESGYVFWFQNAHNPAIGEMDSCYTIYIKWDHLRTDTIVWHYTIDSLSHCREQKMATVYYNGTIVTPTYDTAYQYYFLKK